MPPAPRPDNEQQRLARLSSYGVLDTLPERAYDDITLLASRICGTPIALVSLVDADRQWFKSRHGLEATETPREVAFCAHAILRPDELFEVPDAAADPRFRDNPLVTGSPCVRFYAGAPLVASDGSALGTLCVIDHEPRDLTPEQRDALGALGRQVLAQLELRKAVADLGRRTVELERSRQALEQSNQDLEQFAHVAAHDLKSPLRLIKSFAELLDDSLRDQLDDETREYLGFILASADRGQRLVEGILAYSRLDADGGREAVDLGALLSELRAAKEHEGANLIFECGPLPMVLGDAGQLQQLFGNLIDNAVKYNESEKAQLSVSAISHGDNCSIQIRDNGIGIPERHHNKVFDMFSRVHGGERYQGTGIGLAICKRIMELHDGGITVTGNPDGGSVFSCRFPGARILEATGDESNLGSVG